MAESESRATLTEGNSAEACMTRAIQCLEGLSCGDAFGECFFEPQHCTPEARAARRLPPQPWRFTDDTMMAISVCCCLARHGGIDPEWLAGSFSRLYDPLRGYGAAMHGLMTRLCVVGEANWFEEAQELFDGEGSFGNGAAMRVAPVGAYFAHDLGLVAEHGALSAIATHCHPEAAAGAVATALGAALAWRDRAAAEPITAAAFLEQVRERTPPSAVRDGIDRALRLPSSTSTIKAATALGNGAHVTVVDTVPFALWSAAMSLSSYEDALWNTVNGGGDIDTNCAIVGGVVVMRTGAKAIPQEWVARREPFAPILAVALQE